MFSKELGPPQAPSTGISNWVSIAECVNAEGGSIPPMVIHIGKAPQRGWFGPDHVLPLYKGWKFGFSEKGWTDNDLGVLWLRDHYIPAAKKDDSHHLLILDGHNSH
jgi:DDE superfamily endonuclease